MCSTATLRPTLPCGLRKAGAPQPARARTGDRRGAAAKPARGAHRSCRCGLHQLFSRQTGLRGRDRAHPCRRRALRAQPHAVRACGVLLEFVSANPTGPLHVGHGRQAAYGATLAGLLDAVGFSVEREYYVNDAGRQMDIFAVSVWCAISSCVPRSSRFRPTVTAATMCSRSHNCCSRRKARVSNGPLPRSARTCRPMRPREIRRSISMRSSLARVNSSARMDFAKYQTMLAAMLHDIRSDLCGSSGRVRYRARERRVEESGAIRAALARLEARRQSISRGRARSGGFARTIRGREESRGGARKTARKTYFASTSPTILQKRERGFSS